jgi:predicted nucleic acid-binding protein
MDILIGAIAYVRSQTLITRNRRHFADMPGLAVEDY